MAATTEAETTSATATVVALWPHAWRSQRRLGRARGPTRPHGPAVQLQLQTIISVRGKCASGKHAPAPPALHTPHPKGDMTCRGGGAQHASQPARGTTSTAPLPLLPCSALPARWRRWQPRARSTQTLTLPITVPLRVRCGGARASGGVKARYFAISCTTEHVPPKSDQNRSLENSDSLTHWEAGGPAWRPVGANSRIPRRCIGLSNCRLCTVLRVSPGCHAWRAVGRGRCAPRAVSDKKLP